MPKPPNFSGQGVPVRFAVALVIASVFGAFISVDQSHWWRLKPDYAFGWLVPAFVVFLVVDRWPRLQDVLHPADPSPLPRWLAAVACFIAGSVLGIGLLVFLFGAVYRASEGPSQPGSFALATGFSGILLGIVFFNAPAGRVRDAYPVAGWRALGSDTRVRAAAIFMFPALIWILSAPLVTAVENALSLFLLHRVVASVSFVFGILGLPLLRQGNVLVLPHGQVGVAEACSGIRSLTGCLFAGSFLAALFLERFWQKILLIVAALLLAFLTNLLRSLFLTSWAYAYGSDAIEGKLHDATGWVVLGLTTICLFCLLPLLSAANWRRWLGLSTSPAR